MDYRTERFLRKFNEAGHQFGVKPNEVVSLKVRENVNSYDEYHKFLHILEHDAGINWSPIDNKTDNLQGKGYVVSDGLNQVILVEHETGLEILYIAGSIASLISLVPMVLQGWRAFRGHHLGRHDFDSRGIEIRRLDENGHLSEDQRHNAMALAMPFSINNAIASAAKSIESDLSRLKDTVQSLTHRIEVLEKRKSVKTKRHELKTVNKGTARKNSR